MKGWTCWVRDLKQYPPRYDTAAANMSREGEPYYDTETNTQQVRVPVILRREMSHSHFKVLQPVGVAEVNAPVCSVPPLLLHITRYIPPPSDSDRSTFHR